METGVDNGFNEAEWLKMLFVISDTEQWLDDLSYRLFRCLPVPDKKKLFRRTYYLTAGALAHIIERHYYKIPRHPGAGKFTIPLADILHHLRGGSSLPVEPVSGSLHSKRVVEAPDTIGIDKDGLPTCLITILTDAGGQIITAFPGSL
jgi:hypothetical protein